MTLLTGTEHISAERIILRRIQPSDLEYFVHIHSNPEVARYIGAGNPRPRAETEQWLADILESYERANLGQLAVVRKEDGVLLGRCGLSDAAIEKSAAQGLMRKGCFSALKFRLAQTWSLYLNWVIHLVGKAGVKATRQKQHDVSTSTQNHHSNFPRSCLSFTKEIAHHLQLYKNLVFALLMKSSWQGAPLIDITGQ